MQWAVRQTAEAENHMTSVERVLTYTQLPQERPATVTAGGGAPPKGWPSSAKLEFDRVEVLFCSYSVFDVFCVGWWLVCCTLALGAPSHSSNVNMNVSNISDVAGTV